MRTDMLPTREAEMKDQAGEAPLEQTREHRRAVVIARAHRLARDAERRALTLRLSLARSL